MSEEILSVIDCHCISFLRFYFGNYPSSCLKFSFSRILSKRKYEEPWATTTATVMIGFPRT